LGLSFIRKERQTVIVSFIKPPPSLNFQQLGSQRSKIFSNSAKTWSWWVTCCYKSARLAPVRFFPAKDEAS